MLESEDASRARGIVLLAEVRDQRLTLHKLSTCHKNSTSSRAVASTTERTMDTGTWQCWRSSNHTAALARAVQVLEAAPESLRGPADASLLADFFSARLADWCGSQIKRHFRQQ